MGCNCIRFNPACSDSHFSHVSGDCAFCGLKAFLVKLCSNLRGTINTIAVVIYGFDFILDFSFNNRLITRSSGKPVIVSASRNT